MILFICVALSIFMFLECAMWNTQRKINKHAENMLRMLGKRAGLLDD